MIVAEIHNPKPGNQIILSYSHRVSSNVTAGSLETRRRYFGLTPSTFDIALHPFAFHVDAYHHEIVGSPGQYVYDHHLEWLNSASNADQRTFEADALEAGLEPYVRIYGTGARSSAHLYIRRQAEGFFEDRPAPIVVNETAEPTDDKPEETESGAEATAALDKSDANKPHRRPSFTGNLKSVVQFREIPPGALGAATVIAAASAAIISFFAITHSGLDVNPNADPQQAQSEQIKATLNSDMPALLLALPAFIGVLIGSWLELARLRRAAVTTYLALAMTMFLTIVSALYFVFDANHILPTATTIQIHGFFGGGPIKMRTDWVWLGLMGVAITHFCFLLRSTVSESRYYRKRIERPLASL